VKKTAGNIANLNAGVVLMLIAVAFGAIALWNNIKLEYIQESQASTVESLNGYTWSANVGYIRFNNCSDPTNPASCSTPIDYGVNLRPTSQDLMIEGYAWSPSIGFIRFGGLGCPFGISNLNGNGGCNARLVSSGSNYQGRGWARACSVYSNGCSGSLKSTNQRGGWNGWISLSCDNFNSPDDCVTRGVNYGITYNSGTKTISGYAWAGEVGSPINWIRFRNGGIPYGVQDGAGSPPMCNNNGTCDPGELITCGDCSCNNNTICEPPRENGAVCGDCLLTCGNTTCDVGEDAMTCPADCSAPTCGDGVINQPGEQCDDGNLISGDDCTNACLNPFCGDTIIHNQGSGTETCDDGNTTSGDGCDMMCQLEPQQMCGNGIVEPPEQCDDGNTANGDGCTATCFDELQISCNAVPSRTFVDRDVVWIGSIEHASRSPYRVEWTFDGLNPPSNKEIQGGLDYPADFPYQAAPRRYSISGNYMATLNIRDGNGGNQQSVTTTCDVDILSKRHEDVPEEQQ